MRTLVLPMLLLLSATACTSPKASRDVPYGRGSSPIVGGSVDNGHPAVVLIQSDFLCTGTVIAPNVVLTAAHCVVTNPECTMPNCQLLDAGQFTIMGGTEPFDSADWALGAVEVHAAPDYDGANFQGTDMGILILEEEAPVNPIPVLYASAGSDQYYANGTPFVAVGYGLANSPNGADTSGTKRMVDMEITDQSETEFYYGDNQRNTCSGDSGGPAIVEDPKGGEMVIGVVSYGDENCQEFGANIRTDGGPADDFIQTHAPSTGGGGGPGPTPTPTPGEPGGDDDDDDDDDDELPGGGGQNNADGGLGGAVGCSVAAGAPGMDGSILAIFALAGLVAATRRRRS